MQSDIHMRGKSKVTLEALDDPLFETLDLEDAHGGKVVVYLGDETPVKIQRAIAESLHASPVFLLEDFHLAVDIVREQRGYPPRAAS